MAATITVVCPFCNNRMRASAEYTGRKGRCPSCKALLEIRPADEPSMETIHPTAAAFVGDVDARLGSTAVSGWQSGAIAAAVTAALYAGVWALWKATGYGALVVDRGPMPFCILLLAAWGLVMLAMKYAAVRRQRGYAERELELIPLEVGVQITPDNLDQFLDHLASRPRMQRLSIVGRRIQGALEHFKSRQSVPEVQQYLATQAELDASAVDSGYTLLRSFIWAVPILGFIGTVMGISLAVAGLEVGGQGGGQQMLDGIRLVTGGLASAFDTTLLALLMAVVLLFPTESLRKTEYAMLDRIEAFANDSLLRRMAEGRGPVADEQLPDVVRHALDAAFREHQRWLAEWQAQVGRLGQAVGTDLEAGVVRMLEQIRQSESGRVERHEKLIRLLEDVSQKAAEQTANYQQIIGRQQQMWEAYSDGDTAALAEQIGKLARALESRGGRAGCPRGGASAAGGGGGNVITPVADPPAKRAPAAGLLRRLFGNR